MKALRAIKGNHETIFSDNFNLSDSTNGNIQCLFLIDLAKSESLPPSLVSAYTAFRCVAFTGLSK